MGAFLGCCLIAFVLFYCLVALGELLERIADALEDYIYEDEEDAPNNNNVAK